MNEYVLKRIQNSKKQLTAGENSTNTCHGWRANESV